MTLYSVFYSVLCTLYSVFYSVLWTMNFVLSTLYSVLYALYSVLCTLYSVPVWSWSGPACPEAGLDHTGLSGRHRHSQPHLGKVHLTLMYQWMDEEIEWVKGSLCHALWYAMKIRRVWATGAGVFHSLLCNLLSIFCTLYSVICTLYPVLCTLLSVLGYLYSVPSTLYSVICTLYSVICTLYSVLCTLYSLLRTLHSVPCTLDSVPGGQSGSLAATSQQRERMWRRQVMLPGGHALTSSSSASLLASSYFSLWILFWTVLWNM